MQTTVNGGEMNDASTHQELDLELDDAATNSSTSDDSLLTDEEHIDNSELCDEHHIQGPIPLHSILEYVKCSRDVDSISLLAPSISCLIHAMEPKSVVKLMNMVGDIPTTSSRHCVKQKIRKRDGVTKIKKTPLHHFQNITLGTVTANNIRFHLVLYSLQHDGRGKTIGYRPMTTQKRCVIVGALNLARMIQCNRAKRIKRAWTEFCGHELHALGETPINVEEISL